MSGEKRVGFIGLGLMGSAMVERLQARGYDLNVVAHRNRKPIDAAVERGANECRTPGDLATSSDIVMLCVDTSDAVENVMLGPDGVIEHIANEALIIDFGTSLPASTLELAARAADKGASMMDAPLGRTPAHARHGQLNIMAAGASDDFARAKPVLEDLAENLFHVGPLGSGHRLKLINNFISISQMLLYGQAFTVSESAGLPKQTLYEVMSSGPIGNGLLDFTRQYAVDGDRDALAFSVANARKDVGYFLRMIEGDGISSDLGTAAKTVLDRMVNAGFGDRYVSEISDYFGGGQ